MVAKKESWKLPNFALMLPVLCAAAILVSGMMLPALYGQYGNNRDDVIGGPTFLVRVFANINPDNGERLARIYVEFNNDDLTFIKKEDGFQADVQVDVFIRQGESDLASGQTVKRSFTVDRFDKTNSRDRQQYIFVDVPLESGKYSAMITALDKNSNRDFSREASFRFTKDVAGDNAPILSDLILFNEFNSDSTGAIREFNPLLRNRFSSDAESFYLYFSTYVFDDRENLRIKYLLKDAKGEVVLQNQYIQKVHQPFMEHYIRLNRYYFHKTNYVLELAVEHNNQWLLKSIPFSFYWQYIPNSQQDLRLALRQMRYISEADSLDHFKEASFQQQRGYFQRFWKKMDPDPSTDNNEVMEEYFRRVNLANQHFSVSGLPGWKSDRGRIFIKFGEPDDIDRHPFEQQSYPYVIWRYYTLQKGFLFIDRTGFGDYILHPDYYYVEYE